VKRLSNRVSYSIPPKVLALASRGSSWRAIDVPALPNQIGEVGIDWDHCPATTTYVQAELARLSVYLKWGYKWRASPSRTGVHIVVGSFDPLLTPREGFALRDSMGDDRVRLVFDAYRFSRTLDPHYVRGYLFDAKLSEGVPLRAGPWHHVHGLGCVMEACSDA
jgi:hypothetical protein